MQDAKLFEEVKGLVEAAYPGVTVTAKYFPYPGVTLLEGVNLEKRFVIGKVTNANAGFSWASDWRPTAQLIAYRIRPPECSGSPMWHRELDRMIKQGEDLVTVGKALQLACQILNKYECVSHLLREGVRAQRKELRAELDPEALNGLRGRSKSTLSRTFRRVRFEADSQKLKNVAVIYGDGIPEYNKVQI